MAIVRWQPWRDIDTLHNRMNRLFDEVINSSNWRELKENAFPAAELSETEDALELRLEVPGMEAKDLDIQVTKDAVSISGDRKEETQTETNGVTRSEFRYGKFQRVIRLGTLVQNNNVTADYKDGILTLHLPKQEEVKNQAVKVTVS